MFTSRQRQSTAGMTILEVLAVMVVLGILSAIVAPGWVTFTNRQRTNRAQDQILQGIRQAQSEARRLSRTQTVTFDTQAAVPQISVNGLAVSLGEGDLKEGFLGMQVLDGNGDLITDAAERKLSFSSNGGLQPGSELLTILVFSPANAANPTKRCVKVQTLLGATTLASDNDCPALAVPPAPTPQ
ncbi:MAG: type II secretion system protein [Synechococcales bacterium]|nr:type II secretion system protein [Synechococcales bacterium]